MISLPLQIFLLLSAVTCDFYGMLLRLLLVLLILLLLVLLVVNLSQVIHYASLLQYDRFVPSHALELRHALAVLRWGTLLTCILLPKCRHVRVRSIHSPK